MILLVVALLFFNGSFASGWSESVVCTKEGSEALVDSNRKFDFDIRSSGSYAMKDRNPIDYIPVGNGVMMAFDCSYGAGSHYSYAKYPLAPYHCTLICANEAGCTHFEHFSDDCYLKKHLPTGVRPHTKKYSVCGFKKKNFLWRSSNNGIRWADGCTYPDAFYSEKNTNLDSCVDSCHLDSECAHLVFSDGMCRLSNGTADPVLDDPSSICGFKPKESSVQTEPVWNIITGSQVSLLWHHGCYYDDEQKKNYFAATLKECQADCLNDTRCTSFNWAWHKGGLCEKLYDLVLNPSCANNFQVCGLKTTESEAEAFKCGPDEESEWLKGKNDMWWSTACSYIMIPFERIQMKEARKMNCLEKCGKNPNCTHVSWMTDNNGYCTLMAADQKNPALSRVTTSNMCGHKGTTGGRIYYTD